MVGLVKSPALRHRAKVRPNQRNRGRDMAIFRFSKMAAAAILGFQNFKFLAVGGLKRVKLLRHAKFGPNRANRCADMTIFRFFQDGGCPPSWICCVSDWTIHEGRLVFFINVKSLVVIDAVVSIICKF